VGELTWQGLGGGGVFWDVLVGHTIEI